MSNFKVTIDCPRNRGNYRMCYDVTDDGVFYLENKVTLERLLWHLLDALAESEYKVTVRKQA